MVDSSTPLSDTAVPSDTASFSRTVVRLLRAREVTLIIMVIVIGLALQLVTGRFLTTPNLNAIALGFSTSAIIVFGMTAALVSGGFDLSVGSVLRWVGWSSR